MGTDTNLTLGIPSTMITCMTMPLRSIHGFWARPDSQLNARQASRPGPFGTMKHSRRSLASGAAADISGRPSVGRAHIKTPIGAVSGGPKGPWIFRKNCSRGQKICSVRHPMSILDTALLSSILMATRIRMDMEGRRVTVQNMQQQACTNVVDVACLAQGSCRLRCMYVSV